MKIAFIQDLIMSMEPMGIAYLSAVLKQNGCSVKYFEVPKKGFLARIKTFQPDILAYTVFSTNYSLVGKINRKLKREFPKAFSIVGGPHCTYSPEYIEEFEDIDGLCIGEGEEAIQDFINLYKNEKDYLQTKNWCFRYNNKIIKNEVRPLIADLDKIPFPDLETILEENNFLKLEPIRRMLTSRGCFFHCSYCHNQAFHKLYQRKGAPYRSRSVDNIVQEAMQIKQKYAPKIIIFVDDIFGVRLNLDEFAQEYSRKVNIPFVFNAHSSLVNEDYASKLKKAGGCIVTIGLENVDERITKEILNRDYNIERLTKSVKYLKQTGLKVLANVIIGNPGETFNIALKSYKFCIENKLDGATASILRPYPKTAIYEYCKKNNIFECESDQYSHAWGKSMLKFDNKLEKCKIENFQKFFGFLVIYPKLFSFFRLLLYMPPNIIFDSLLQIVFHYTKYRLTPFKFSSHEKYYITVNIIRQFKYSLFAKYDSFNFH